MVDHKLERIQIMGDGSQTDAEARSAARCSATRSLYTQQRGLTPLSKVPNFASELVLHFQYLVALLSFRLLLSPKISAVWLT